MKTSVDYDYLLIGQGLAGTNLAWHLTEAGKRFLIINDSSRPSSSMVAAGILNPLTGKKLVKTWMADELFPYAFDFYSRLEKVLDSSFFHPIRMYRPYRSLEEQNYYLAQTADSGIARYVEKDLSTPNYEHCIHAPYGGLHVKGAAWLDIPVFLDKSRGFFLRNSNYLEAEFKESDLQVSDTTVNWKGYSFNKVILCQGVEASVESLFGWLPFNPVKGQVLDVFIPSYPVPDIVNQGIFILPIADGRCKVGATYSWHDLDWECTTEGRAYLQEKLRPLLKGPYEIRHQKAGIRPSSKDRRPMIGLHPENNKVGIFNGLGTKGVSLSPYFACHFVDHLEKGKDLNPLVNIDRYFSLYFHSSKPQIKI